MATPDIPLRQFLLRQRAHKERVPDVGALIEDIAQATRRISFLVAPPRLLDDEADRVVSMSAAR